ncbi:MAG TPA: hypothetical protein VH370_11320 [Humisphaera sp.]|jgi:hypothetical protein|nr:hypothetical protein [Humisphaera sp.]
MIAVRIFKKLDAAIASLPELDPLVGKFVEIVVLEESEPEATSAAVALDDEGIAPQTTPVVPPREALITPVAAPVTVVDRPPTRQRVRICGKIDRVGDNGDSFRLILSEELAVPCTWASEGVSPVIGAAGSTMAIAGTGIFDHAGILLRIDVKSASPAMPTDSRFSRIPKLGEEEPSDAPPEPVLVEAVATTAPIEPPAIPLEPPRPALSAATSFTAIFGRETEAAA